MGPIQVPQPRQAEEEEADEQEQEHLKGPTDPRYLREGEELGSLFEGRIHRVDGQSQADRREG
jgi:hypothetical protein